MHSQMALETLRSQNWHIYFQGSEQAALKSYTAASLARKNGQLLTMDDQGYGYRKGIAFSEFLEEAATELTASYLRR